LYPLQPEGGIRTVDAIAKERDCHLTIPDTDALRILRCDLSGNRFQYRGQEYEQGLLGQYQIYNACVVLEAIYALRQGGLTIPEESVQYGLKHCRMPARFDKVSNDPLIILDAGHNPQGIDALTDLMDKMEGRRTRIVFTVMADKEYAYAIDSLSKRAECFYAVTLKDFPRALPAEEIVSLAKRHCDNCLAFSDVETAISAALEEIGEDCLLICGSFYLMEQAMNALKNKGIL